MRLFSLVSTLCVAAGLVRAEVHKIQVGMNSTGPALAFNPSEITAAEGDEVQFIFRNKNHTVTQSSFADPCTQLNTSISAFEGVDSGFLPAAANATELPTWSIRINNASTPLWFFCKQGNHCAAGMVFSINAAASGEKTFAAYQSRAMGNVASSNSTASSPIEGAASSTPAGTTGNPTEAPLNAQVTNTSPAAAEATVSVSAGSSLKLGSTGRWSVAVAVGGALLSSMML
ncbi:hypothetical protein CPB86DRAFT_825220 [Serendipita vermifera]|nr:hypothetical protein CPB86DRAFT_825220 [Serendipita vermifera]